MRHKAMLGPMHGAQKKVADQKIWVGRVFNLINRMAIDDEGVLIARSRKGDWDALAALIRMYKRMIHRGTARKLGRSEA